MVGWRSMKAPMRARHPHHHADGEDDGRDHDGQLIGLGEADRREHRVEREHDVDDGDLHHDDGEVREHARLALVFGAFERAVDLGDALGEQEQAA